jgi:hypothetical protein
MSDQSVDTYTGQHDAKNEDIHPCLSGIRVHDLSIQVIKAYTSDHTSLYPFYVLSVIFVLVYSLCVLCYWCLVQGDHVYCLFA